MWERIAERLVAECKEMDITCDKSEKKCRDTINNLSNDSRKKERGVTQGLRTYDSS